MSDNQSGDQFDRDDELRAMLRSGDPAGSLSPADPAALASLLEDIMSADLDVRPETDEGDRRTGTHGRNRMTWLVAAAAVAAIAAGGGFAISGLGEDGDAGQQQAGPESSVTAVDPNAPAPGTSELSVAPQQGRCAEATPELLAQYQLAFQGTVTAIEGDTVTLQTTDVLNGEVTETVEVTAPQPVFDAMINTVDFQVGEDYLVAAYDGQVSMCYTGSATGQLRSPFEKAFVH
jgi:hypothetical protein